MRTTARPLAEQGAVNRHVYEGAFGLLLFGVLLISTLDQDAFAQPARGLMLACFALLVVLNIGAALGVYIGAVALFSVHHFAGQGSWVQRPDNFAFLMLVGYLLVGRSFSRTAGVFGWTAGVIGLLLLITFIQLLAIVGFSTYEVSWYIRSFAMPLALFILLRRAALTYWEIRALLLIAASLAIYFAAISLLEVAGWHELLIPPWLADPDFNVAYRGARAGGLPMQPEWNAIDISLGLCALWLRLEFLKGPAKILWMAGAVVCALGVYFTYTRAAWLGLLIGGVPLFWQMSADRGVTLRRRVLFTTAVLGFSSLVLLFPSDILRARSSDSGTVYFRLSIWVAGLDMLIQHPLFGVGFGQFALHLSSFLRDLVWIPAADAAQEGTLAHNTFLNVGAEFGLVGLTLYTVLLVGVYRAARDSATAAWGQRGRTWVAGYMLVYLVNLQFITAHKLTSNVLFFGLMGAIAGMRWSRDTRERPWTTSIGPRTGSHALPPGAL